MRVSLDARLGFRRKSLRSDCTGSAGNCVTWGHGELLLQVLLGISSRLGKAVFWDSMRHLERCTCSSDGRLELTFASWFTLGHRPRCEIRVTNAHLVDWFESAFDRGKLFGKVLGGCCSWVVAVIGQQDASALRAESHRRLALLSVLQSNMRSTFSLHHVEDHRVALGCMVLDRLVVTSHTTIMFEETWDQNISFGRLGSHRNVWVTLLVDDVLGVTKVLPVFVSCGLCGPIDLRIYGLVCVDH